MKTIVTLGPDVRLLAIQFHMKKESVPEGIPKFSEFHKLKKSEVGNGGVCIMNPTSDVQLTPSINGDYQLIDVWAHIDEENWYQWHVRYVFCRPEYLYPDELHPYFVARREYLLESMNNLLNKNLWKTMAHLNPFSIDNQATDQKVLMLDCNSRKPTVKLVPTQANEGKEKMELVEQPITVFQGGHDKITNQGVGPRVLLTDKAHRLKLINNDVVLEAPEPVTVLVD